MDRRNFLAGAGAFAIGPRLLPRFAAQKSYLLYLGSRSMAEGKGLYVCRFVPGVGLSGPLTLVADVAAPSTFALSADHTTLYTTSETGNDGKSDGKLLSFRINRPDGKLTPISEVASSGGGPTSICIDKAERHLIVGCFGHGRSNVFELGADGAIGKMASSEQHQGSGPTPRQNGPHTHHVLLSPTEKFLLSADLGSDRFYISHYDKATGTITPGSPAFLQMPAGSGPRNAVFHPNGKFLYLVGEICATIFVFAWNEATGSLTQIQTIIPSTPTSSGGMVHIAPGGRFLYINTRADSVIHAFPIDRRKGTLARGQSFSSGGKTPWNFDFSPDGGNICVPNNASNLVSVFSVNHSSGALMPLGQSLPMAMPVSAIFVQA